MEVHRYFKAKVTDCGGIRAHSDGVAAVTISPDSKLLQTLAGHSSYVIALAISPDGKLLASGSIDKTIKLWSLPDGKLLLTFRDIHTSFLPGQSA